MPIIPMPGIIGTSSSKYYKDAPNRRTNNLPRSRLRVNLYTSLMSNWFRNYFWDLGSGKCKRETWRRWHGLLSITTRAADAQADHETEDSSEPQHRLDGTAINCESRNLPLDAPGVDDPVSCPHDGLVA